MSRIGTEKNEDKMRFAEMQLTDTIQELKDKETELKSELNTIAASVKRAQAAKATSKVKQLLVSSVSKRNNLSLTTKRRLALEQQMDAIATTQLNQQVLSSMKETSKALKSLGLDSTLNSVDEVMADMQDSTSDINDITQTLSSSLTYETLDDDTLQTELALLMGDEVDGITDAPITANSITSTDIKNPITDIKPSSDDAKSDKNANLETVEIGQSIEVPLSA